MSGRQEHCPHTGGRQDGQEIGHRWVAHSQEASSQGGRNRRQDAGVTHRMRFARLARTVPDQDGGGRVKWNFMARRAG
jgi:hypothetical protein